MFKTIKAFNERRKTRRELEQLTDKELSDIGITRADIPFIVKTIV